MHYPRCLLRMIDFVMRYRLVYPQVPHYCTISSDIRHIPKAAVSIRRIYRQPNIPGPALFSDSSSKGRCNRTLGQYVGIVRVLLDKGAFVQSKKRGSLPELLYSYQSCKRTSVASSKKGNHVKLGDLRIYEIQCLLKNTIVHC